jgi:phosphoenolpyruvate carboxykinase (ATP)
MMMIYCLNQPQGLLNLFLFVDYRGNIDYLEEDICANGRGILPLSALPKNRLYDSIDLPPIDELDGLYMFFNTRNNTVVPIIQEVTSPEEITGHFMLGESVETAAGDPTKVGNSVRVVGTNPFIVGDEGQEGNMFYEFVKRYQDKIKCYIMNTGGVGEIRDANKKITRMPARPWKNGIAYMTRAILRNTARWEEDPNYSTKVLVGGVTDVDGNGYDMEQFNLNSLYDAETSKGMISQLNKERIEHLEQYATLDPKILSAMKEALKI